MWYRFKNALCNYHYIFYYLLKYLKYQIIKRQFLGEVVKNGKYFNHKLPRCFKYLFDALLDVGICIKSLRLQL